MSNYIHIKLPFKPYSLNDAYRTGNGNMYMAPEAKAFKQKVYEHALSASIDSEFLDKAPFHHMDIVVVGDMAHDKSGWNTIPKGGKPDEDNGIKLMKDAIYNALGLNDNRVFSHRIQQVHCDDKKKEATYIRIRPAQLVRAVELAHPFDVFDRSERK